MLAYAPLIEKRLRQFHKPHCGSIRIDETYIKVRGEWRYLYRAVDKHGSPVDILLTANRDLDAAKRFFRKMLRPHSRSIVSSSTITTGPQGTKASIRSLSRMPPPQRGHEALRLRIR